jgi:hypothetical protein
MYLMPVSPLFFINILVQFLEGTLRLLVDTQQDVFHPIFDGLL